MTLDTLRLSNGRDVPAWSISEVFILSSGPGGQNVNKVSTGVQLRFNAVAVDIFTERQRTGLLRLAGRRATKDGEIIIEATRFRTRERNRLDARTRLLELIEKAIEPPPPPRKKTRPSRGAIERRLRAKANRSSVKKMRNAPSRGQDD
ncbi:MAG: alternative ribosome rescue aminoacyl-tRNA hydrolase ArfB [Pseudomonadota bacterium]